MTSGTTAQTTAFDTVGNPLVGLVSCSRCDRARYHDIFPRALLHHAPPDNAWGDQAYRDDAPDESICLSDEKHDIAAHTTAAHVVDNPQAVIVPYVSRDRLRWLASW